jgi:hypothetical protein
MPLSHAAACAALLRGFLDENGAASPRAIAYGYRG